MFCPFCGEMLEAKPVKPSQAEVLRASKARAFERNLPILKRHQAGETVAAIARSEGCSPSAITARIVRAIHYMREQA